MKKRLFITGCVILTSVVLLLAAVRLLTPAGPGADGAPPGAVPAGGGEAERNRLRSLGYLN